MLAIFTFPVNENAYVYLAKTLVWEWFSKILPKEDLFYSRQLDVLRAAKSKMAK
jgi:hypothetical protein